MRKIGRTILFALASLSFSTASLAKDNKPAISPLELQAIQSRDIDGAKEQVFGSVMSVLQDAGYRIESGDIQTGLITGIGSSKGRMTYNLFLGFGRSKKTPVVSAFIEQFGVTTRVRLNFVMAKIKSTLYGSQPQDEEPITDPAVYQDAFEKINQALFIRQAMVAPKAAAPTDGSVAVVIPVAVVPTPSVPATPVAAAPPVKP